jgi:prophage antirepressor-like protein
MKANYCKGGILLNQLQIFNNPEFGQVRAIEKDGKTYFVGIDIARALGYSNPSKAVIQHCKGVTKLGIPSQGGVQETNCITEGDMYRLITHSELPSAEKFEAWVFDEVLPSIRQNGGYIANQENLSDAEILAKAVIVAQNVIAQKDKLISEMKPKAEFFDTVASSKTAIPMDQVAKVIGKKGIGRNKLFAILRDKRILDRGNIPYQEYVDRGYFRVVEQKYTTPNGETHINIKTLVYQKGVDYIRRLIT